MKKYLLILFVALITFSCTTFKRIGKNQDSIEGRIIYTKNKDTIIVQQDSLNIQFYTKNFNLEYDNFHKRDNRGQILMSIENSVRLSPESLKKIEEDGTATMKNILNKNNWNKFSHRIPISLSVILSLDNLSISEYKISIYTRNLENIFLSNDEIIKLLSYCKEMQFIYTKDEYKNVKIHVPVICIFAIKKE